MVDNSSDSALSRNEHWEAMPTYAAVALDIVKLYNQTILRYLS